MRVLITIPHFFDGGAARTDNRSRNATARGERLRALVATLASLHQAFGSTTFGLDHGERMVWPMTQAAPHALDIVLVTTGQSHLAGEIAPLQSLFRHIATNADPLRLGFECHKLLRDAVGRYDYYGYVEDDIVITDPLFLRKRRLFDRTFGPQALLQPNRYEASPSGPVHKLYVDYRLNPRVTARYQNVADAPQLAMPFLDETITFERTTYPSAGCFFLNDAQLALLIGSPHFLDGDVSYLSPLDSAVTLSVMKVFRVYKPALNQAWFLEVLHASPRWIGSVAQIARLATSSPPPADVALSPTPAAAAE
jgi:hypothetical protein